MVEERRARILVADAQSKSGGAEKYSEDVDLLRLDSGFVVDTVVQPENLRHDRAVRLDYLACKRRHFSDRRHAAPLM